MRRWVVVVVTVAGLAVACGCGGGRTFDAVFEVQSLDASQVCLRRSTVPGEEDIECGNVNRVGSPAGMAVGRCVEARSTSWHHEIVKLLGVVDCPTG